MAKKVKKVVKRNAAGQPLKKQERFSLEKRKTGFSVTRDYYNAAVIKPLPAYSLSVADRYSDFRKWATDYSNEFMIEVSGRRQDTSKRLFEEINRSKKHEASMSKDMLKALGVKQISRDPSEQLLRLLNETYKNKIAEYTVQPEKLADLVEYRIGQYLVENKLVVGGGQPFIDKYNILSTGETSEQFAKAAEAIRNNFESIIKTGRITSPALIRQLSIFNRDPEILKGLTDLTGMNFIGFAGTLYEPLALLSTSETFLSIGEQFKTQAKAMFQLTGSIQEEAAETITNFLDNAKLVLSDGTAFIDYRKNTKMSGDVTFGKADFIFKLPGSKAVGVDVKNTRSDKDTYMVRSPTLSQYEILKSADENNMPKEAIKGAMNMILNQTLIKGSFQLKDLTAILRPILLALVASNESMDSFFFEFEKNKRRKANLILINGRFYMFSKMLEGMRKTYFNPRGIKDSPIMNSNTLMVNTGSLGSITQQNKDLLLQKKKNALNGLSFVDSKGKQRMGMKPMERLKLIQNSGEIKDIMNTFNLALSSVSYKVRFTINMNTIVKSLNK